MDVMRQSREALKGVDKQSILATADMIRSVGQLFVVGNGGGYSHAAHFAADLRKIAGIRAHSFDSMGELTARVNDDGWEHAIYDWAHALGRHPENDRWFLFSCGGGLDGLSRNLPAAYNGIVGRAGACHSRIVIPSTNTPVIEGCQSVIAHQLVELVR